MEQRDQARGGHPGHPMACFLYTYLMVSPCSRSTDSEKGKMVTDRLILGLLHARDLLWFLFPNWQQIGHAMDDGAPPARLMVIFGCWAPSVEQSNAVSRFPSISLQPIVSLSFSFYVSFDHSFVSQDHPRTYLFLTLRFNVLIGFRKEKLGLLFVTLVCSSKILLFRVF